MQPAVVGELGVERSSEHGTLAHEHGIAVAFGEHLDGRADRLDASGRG